jgi:hypothetical protein
MVTTMANLRTAVEQYAKPAQDLEAFAGLNLTSIRDNVEKALAQIGKLGLFEEYTLHDSTHIDAMLETYDWIIPDATKSIMTPAEWLMLTLSTYLHDFGMLVTREEYDQRDTTRFRTFVDSATSSSDADTRDYQANLRRLGLEEREKFLYQEFVRTNHAPRIRSWLSDEPDPRLGFDSRVVALLRQMLGSVEPTFVDDLGLVCESHHRDDLYDVERYPIDKPFGRTAAEAANIQYVAILLRCADLLHITRDRTPSVAFRLINPKNPTSLVEWAKQQPVRRVRPKKSFHVEGSLEPPPATDSVEVHAQFTEGKGFFGLTSYLQYAGDELRQCWNWARESQARYGSQHQFPWRRIDTSNVKAKGFVAKQFEFTLDQRKVLDLLTGHTLYNDTSVVIRELTQNAIDAGRLQKLVQDDEQYLPEVIVRLDRDQGVLQVIDNGTGMTESAINENFLHVGSSRYQTHEFKKRFPGFTSISRFGIGVLSAFMISDDLRVLTVSPDEAQAREITLESVHGQYLMRLIPKSSIEIPDHIRKHGTMLELRARHEQEVARVYELLQKWIVVPGCKVFFEEGNERKPIGYSSATEALGAYLELINKSVVGYSRFSDMEVKTAHIEGLELAYLVRWNKWAKQYSLVSSPGGQNRDFDMEYDFAAQRAGKLPIPTGTAIEGVRVTVDPPAFQSGGVWALANVTGQGAPRTNVARSALEQGPEFDKFLKNVFEAYVDHVAREVEAMHTNRGWSLTRAVHEVPYVSRSFVDSRPTTPQAVKLHYEAQRKIPFFVVEDPEARRAVSVMDLVSLGEVATFDNEILEGVDYLLSSLPRSVTMHELIRFLGVQDLKLPDVPILRLGRGANIELIRSVLEVSKIQAFDHSTVESRWTRQATDQPRWISTGNAKYRRAYSIMGNERDITRTDRIWSPLINTEFIGPDGIHNVRVGGDIYMVGAHPALRIKPLNPNTPLEVQRWFSAGLVGLKLALQSYNFENRDGSDPVGGLLDVLRRGNVLQFFDEDSVVEAYMDTPRQILDPRYSWRKEFDQDKS